MDLDIGQVRAFVEVADQRHFGRAAQHLFLSQQALSKRIQRLEGSLGEHLLRRGRGSVELTAAGQRLLPHARELVAAADRAANAMRDTARPLQLDVWGPIQAPLDLVRRFNQRYPDLIVELSMRRSMSAALDALQRQDLDAAFGRPHDIDRPWPDGLAHRIVHAEPLVAVITAGHPLEKHSVIGPDHLRARGLWWPLAGSPSELIGFFQRYCDEHHIPSDLGGPNLGLDHFLTELPKQPERVTLAGRHWPLPPDVPLRTIPIEPAPCYPWALVWPLTHPHPAVARLLDFLDESTQRDIKLGDEPSETWIPEPDRLYPRRPESSLDA